MEYPTISEEEKSHRRRVAEMIYKHSQDSFMQLIHNDEAHKRTLNPEEGVVIPDFFKEAKDVFDEYPDISAMSIFERYLDDEKNGVRKIKWDVIPAGQYKLLLERYMDMGEYARIPLGVVSEWFKKLKRNTVILYYLSYMCHRKHGFPFEIVPIETDSVPEAQLWLFVNTNFYSWAKFSTGAQAYSDRAFGQLFKCIRGYKDDMSPEEVLVLINRMIHVSHPRDWTADISECFIEGGRETCNKITNG